MTRPQREIDLDYRVALALGDIGEIAAWERRWFSQQAAAAPAEFAPTPADDAVLERAFAEVAAVVAARQRAFADAAAAVRRAGSPQRRELRDDAQKWLEQGLHDAGGEQQEDWDTALGLLETLTGDPAGGADHVAWFQLGYLRWQHRQDVAAAAQAFARAQEIGAARKDAYFVAAARHLAHMHHRRGDDGAALAAITPALVLGDDHDTLFDAARYAARTGRDDLCRELLGKCVDARPATVVAMFAEPDLGGAPQLGAFAAARLEQARESAAAQVASWQETAAAVAQVEQAGEIRIDLPAALTEDGAAARDRLAGARFLEVVAIAQEAEAARGAIAARVEKALTAERDRRAAEVVTAKRAIAAAEQGSKQAGTEFEADAARRRREAEAAAPSASAVDTRLDIAVRIVVAVTVLAALVKALLEQTPGHFLAAILDNLKWAAIVVAVVLVADGLRRVVRRQARRRTPEEAAAAARRDERTGKLAAQRQEAEARLVASEAARHRAEAALALVKAWQAPRPRR